MVSLATSVEASRDHSTKGQANYPGWVLVDGAKTITIRGERMPFGPEFSTQTRSRPTPTPRNPAVVDALQGRAGPRVAGARGTERSRCVRPANPLWNWAGRPVYRSSVNGSGLTTEQAARSIHRLAPVVSPVAMRAVLTDGASDD